MLNKKDSLMLKREKRKLVTAKTNKRNVKKNSPYHEVFILVCILAKGKVDSLKLFCCSF